MSRKITTAFEMVNTLDHIAVLKSARCGSSLSVEVCFDGELSEYLIIFNKGFDTLLCFVAKKEDTDKAIKTWAGSYTASPFDQVFQDMLQLAIKYLEKI